jgi:ketosteroid isomerase-like protein
MTTPFAGASIRPAPAEFLAVVDALYRFGAGQDCADRPLFESAFAADAVVDFTGPAGRFGAVLPVFRGRPAIADMIMATTAPLRTTHTVTNPRVTVDGDQATLWALVEAQHVPRADDSRHFLLKNSYTVDLIRAEPDWLITRMIIDTVWSSGDPAVLFGPPA